MLKAKLLAGGGAETLYVDDVFSAYTYTGNGSTQTITNGIDLSGKGGMVWFKSRSAAIDHWLVDTDRTGSKGLYSNATSAQATATNSISAFNSNGFSITNASGYENSSGGASSYISWTFRKAPKFFDVVTWTGDGTARNITHSLGVTPGMVIVKCTNNTSSWFIKHLSLPSDILRLESTAAKEADTGYFGSVNSSTFGVTGGATNILGYTYVAYLFAHDTGTDGIIQCGSYVGNGAATGPTVTLGWEPQYVMIKAASGGGSWRLVDSARGMVVSGVDMDLRANTTDAEYSAEQWVTPMATGFNTAGGNNNNTGVTYIYLAIRRPNKPPTVGTQVYNAIARTGTGAAATVTGVGFAPDLVALRSRSGTTGGRWEDRLRGATIEISSNATTVEAAVAQSLTAFGMDGFALGTDGDWNTSAATYISWCFKRAPGVFDVVCYTGNGGTNTQSHNLGAIPELMILKGRSTPSDWGVYVGSISQMYYKLTLQTTDAAAVNNSLFSAAPTASSFTLNTTNLNNNAGTYVAYLFATKAGISKVFNYTGNGSSQTINCGFTTGARFVLIKRTDIAGDWYVWDTVRGIIAGNDPHLSLNATAAEVTTNDSIDPDSSGFIVNQVAATNINVTSATYIGLAFA